MAIPDPATTNWVPIWNPLTQGPVGPPGPALNPVWVDVPFNAADYTASGGAVWNVAAGNVSANQYCVIGKVLLWNLVISATTITVAPATNLNVAIPTGFTTTNQAQVVGTIFTGSLWNPSLVIYSGGLTVTIYKIDTSALPVGDLYTTLQLILPIL